MLEVFKKNGKMHTDVLYFQFTGIIVKNSGNLIQDKTIIIYGTTYEFECMRNPKTKIIKLT